MIQIGTPPIDKILVYDEVIDYANPTSLGANTNTFEFAMPIDEIINTPTLSTNEINNPISSLNVNNPNDNYSPPKPPKSLVSELQVNLSNDTHLGSVSPATPVSIQNGATQTSSPTPASILSSVTTPIKSFVSGITGGGSGSSSSTTTPVASNQVKKDYTMYYIGIPIVLIGLLVGYKTLKK